MANRVMTRMVCHFSLPPFPFLRASCFSGRMPTRTTAFHIALDLDHTLISTHRVPNWAQNHFPRPTMLCRAVEVAPNRHIDVVCRPHLAEAFLALKSMPDCELHIFTANSKEYAQRLLSFPPFSSTFDSARVKHRGDTTMMELDGAMTSDGKQEILAKDLRCILGDGAFKIWSPRTFLPNCFLVDDRVESYIATQPANGIPIRPFHAANRWTEDEVMDDGLLQVVPLLCEIHSSFRKSLDLREHEKRCAELREAYMTTLG